MTLATLVDGKTDLADVLMLVAFILFVVCAVLRWIAHSVDGMLMAAGLACLALAFFVL